MTRVEALHILGLGADATDADVRTAHRELAQMLHPDKFEGNKRLHARAEQQMRSINAARDYLLSDKGKAAAASAGRRPAAGGPRPADFGVDESSSGPREAARSQARAVLVQQLADVRSGLTRARYLVAGGLIALLIGFRLRGMVMPFVVNSAGLTALVWGAQDLARLGRMRRLLRQRLKEISAS